MFKIKYKYFPNLGWLEMKLTPDILNFLKECIKNKKGIHNKKLAGNIEKSYVLEDKNNWFFKNILIKCINAYIAEFGNHSIPILLTKDCEYLMDGFWVNYQKKTQYNPFHSHSGVFSFVIWLDIPFSYKKEAQLKFVKHARTQAASTFQFYYINILGRIGNLAYELEPKDAGTMLFFPASLNHMVYPFYTSNKNRISLSGNIKLNPEKIIPQGPTSDKDEL